MDGLIALGSGGAAAVTSFTLFVGVRGKNKIKIDDDHVPYWAFSIGLLASTAGAAFQGLDAIGTQFSAAFQQAGGLGEWKVGATAALLTVMTFGLKARPWKDTLFGAMAPSVFVAAGGLWAMPVGIVGSVLRSLVGAA